VAKELFSKEINVGKQILVNGETFKVIGILKKQNTAFGGGPNTSGTLYMSLDAYRRITDDLSPSIIFAKTYSAQDADGAVEDIKDKMDERHGTDSVMVSSAESLREQANTVLGLVTIFLAGLAGISLIVGGVGIMNAMITSVIERTKEIGVMKALGASNNKVLAIFSLEASFIGGIGGIIGTVVGFALSGVIAEVAASQGLELSAVISPMIALEGIMFAMIVGVISGFYPALRAARMDPVRALRYE
jgi:putative ABC transport system permease protein